MEDPDKTYMPPLTPFATVDGAAAASHRPDARLEVGMMIGHYRIVRMIGEGGMGAVYEAEQEFPRRTVALKVIKPGLASPELLRRFEQESQALGRLQHVGIAQIYEAGAADTGFGPQPYFAMEFIRGKTLLEFAGDRKLNYRDRMDIMAKVSEAVHHAHQRGLIHRDLKPGNILVDEAGQPKILDFGVARATDGDAQATMQTDIGQLVGTLAYMSPEQVSADPLELDTRSDVYALGVILYELLAGRMPYTISKKLHETIQAIREHDAARLSSVNKSYRGDIETIAAKALEKDKTRRYGSAAELSADIGRFLKDEPIIARPPSATYQMQKFARRHTGLVVGIFLAVVVLIAGAVISAWQARVARFERDRAIVAEQAARSAETEATTAQKAALDAEGQARKDRDIAVNAQQEADAQAETARTQRLLTIWQSLSRESVRDAAGRVDDDRTALLARQALLFHSRTPGNAQYLVELALQQAARPDPLIHIPSPNHSGAVFAVAFSSDGTRLASGSADHTVQVWDLRSPSAAPLVLAGHEGNVYALAFSSDGMRIASASADKFVRVWDLRNAKAAPLRLQGPQAALVSMVFSPDGTQLAAAGVDKDVRLWNLRNSDAEPAVFSGHEGGVNAVAFSPDGTLIASASDDKTVRLWNARDSKVPPTVIQGHEAAVLSVTFSPDGSRLATGSADTTTRAWNVRTPASPMVFRGHENPVLAVAFSADGLRLMSAGKDQLVRVWDARSPGAPQRVIGETQGPTGVAAGNINSLAFSPDLSRLASAGEDRVVRVLDLRNATTQPVVFPGPQGPARFGSDNVHSLAYSIDSGRLASASRDNTVRVWDLRNNGAPPVALQGQQGAVRSLVFSRDGTRMTSAGVDRSVREWDLRNPTASPTLLLAAQGDVRLGMVALSQDGLRLASAARDSVLKFWPNLRVPNSQPLVLKGQQGAVETLTFSGDGAWLAAAGLDNQVRLWDLRKPEAPAVVLQGQTGAVRSIAFSRDGTQLATGGGDKAVRVWNLRSLATKPATFQGSESVINSVAFSPDGLRLAAGGVDRTVRLWDFRTPEAPPVRFEGHVSDILSVVFSPDGSRLTAGGFDGSVRSWHLCMVAADYLCTRVWRNLSRDEWRFYIGEDIPYEQTCPAIPSGAGGPGK